MVSVAYFHLPLLLMDNPMSQVIITLSSDKLFSNNLAQLLKKLPLTLTRQFANLQCHYKSSFPIDFVTILSIMHANTKQKERLNSYNLIFLSTMIYVYIKMHSFTSLWQPWGGNGGSDMFVRASTGTQNKKSIMTPITYKEENRQQTVQHPS